MRRVLLATATALAAVLCVGTTPVHAQMTGAPTAGFLGSPGEPASVMPAALREIGFDQLIDHQLPLDARFTDDEGREIALGSLYGKRPVLLSFVYFTCPLLCTQVLNAMTATVSNLPLEAGKDFDLVVISIDPKDTPAVAAAKKAEFVHRYKDPTASSGWHFLTGTEPEIRRVAAAAGFKYSWDEQTQQYAHPTGIIVSTPDGRLARYLFGLEFGPRDLKLALVDASEGKVGTLADQLLLYCYHYDPMTGRYGIYVMRVLRIAGVLTVFSIATFILVMLRKERSSQIPTH